MALLTQAPKGTKDLLPQDIHRWQYIENTVLQTAQLFGFREMRVPTYEHTELFVRSVGNTTDVVQKEMFTFQDMGERSISLRPELTAGVCRSVLQNGLVNGPLPLKVCYVASCFRQENTQAGRLREFHQFGVEMIGAQSAAADAEVISIANEVFASLGVTDVQLQINSIGCPHCRSRFQEALKAYLGDRREELCDTCKGRLEKNPLRIIDCKEEHCQELVKDAPSILDYLCEECANHFEDLKARLTAIGIPFTVNPKIVRGLDYYTKTVFEFVTTAIGAQSTVCGGGRYDLLLEQLGGKATPALGFGMGLERLMMVMQAQNREFPEPQTCDLYIGSMGKPAAIKAQQLVTALRQEGFISECDLMERSVKAQMKYADKIGAKYSMILGDNELMENTAVLKNMATKEQLELPLDESFVSKFYTIILEGAFTAADEALENLLPSLEEPQ